VSRAGIWIPDPGPDPQVVEFQPREKCELFPGSFCIREGFNLGDRVGDCFLWTRIRIPFRVLDPDSDSSLINKIYRSSFGSDAQHSLLGGNFMLFQTIIINKTLPVYHVFQHQNHQLDCLDDFLIR
jgi:hypothetical protein